MESSLRTVTPSEVEGKDPTDVFDVAIVRECLSKTRAAGVLPHAPGVWERAASVVGKESVSS
jgi:hypothetical protein